ncbi:MAG: hypothetical protein Q8J74_03575 [Candidatus Didemnitutus sp.]|nr:hypothetical protein [Candidatus Didemnitutus sp.]
MTLPFGLPLRSLLVLLVGCAAVVSRAQAGDPGMNRVAESYVKLVLAVGLHDGDYVDAYYGPAEWKTEVAGEKPALPLIRERAAELRASLAAMDVSGGEALSRMRHKFLDRQLAALEARVAMLAGTKFTFDEESERLYDAVAPTRTEAYFQDLLVQLDQALPGSGTVTERLEAFRRDFVIPADKIDPVFQAAIAEARKRTGLHLALPAGENFTVEYVTDKPWSAYNWYQGNFQSLIQVNTSLPIYIERAIDLACHEGYPGHHVFNVLLEKNLVRDRGWVEFSVYPLFSPQSFIAEGTGNYGIVVAFPGEERIAFARDVLFPLAGLDPARAAEYARVLSLTKQLNFAGNEAARRYLDGEISAEAAAEWLNRNALMDPARAKQRVRFIDKYRSYVINYNLGEQIVERYVETHAAGDAQRRWEIFAELISTPQLPSGIR